MKSPGRNKEIDFRNKELTHLSPVKHICRNNPEFQAAGGIQSHAFSLLAYLPCLPIYQEFQVSYIYFSFFNTEGSI